MDLVEGRGTLVERQARGRDDPLPDVAENGGHTGRGIDRASGARIFHNGDATCGGPAGER